MWAPSEWVKSFSLCQVAPRNRAHSLSEMAQWAKGEQPPPAPPGGRREFCKPCNPQIVLEAELGPHQIWVGGELQVIVTYPWGHSPLGIPATCLALRVDMMLQWVEPTLYPHIRKCGPGGREPFSCAAALWKLYFEHLFSCRLFNPQPAGCVKPAVSTLLVSTAIGLAGWGCWAEARSPEWPVLSSCHWEPRFCCKYWKTDQQL